jgi:hypothetical protein
MDFLVETDMLIEYLTTENSTLRHALSKGVCYTTFNNALQLFAAAKSPEEEERIQQALMSVRLLGLNWRNAKPFAVSARRIEASTGKKLTEHEMIMIGMAEMSKLTILTKQNFERYTALGVAVADRAA